QTKDSIEKIHSKNPIDWFVFTSALTLENPNPPELTFCKVNNIKISKRDELINQIIKDKDLKLIAVAGTHGKTTTTATMTYLFIKNNLPVSYLLPAKTGFAEMGKYDDRSKYFIYEADEFDRNFLSFEPYISLITGVSWDHHEIFNEKEDYQAAFVEFIYQSEKTIIWQEDADYLNLNDSPQIEILSSSDQKINEIKLDGLYNRLDAFIAISAFKQVHSSKDENLIGQINKFPGLSRRMELIIDGLYTDYAHTPEKIRGAMSVATEMVGHNNKKGLIVLYEPLTDRRQHYIIKEYKNCFSGADKVYWLPSYLAREDPNQAVLSPPQLISNLSDPSIAEPAKRDKNLKEIVHKYLKDNYMVVGMAGGGDNSLDDGLRQEFK
ncbi:MAG TPA: Mur ligase family protein, partial [Patescibacteria group bacterium]|nr:Mur ligase family protein [Patescibacteria group bacterium]